MFGRKVLAWMLAVSMMLGSMPVGLADGEQNNVTAAVSEEAVHTEGDTAGVSGPEAGRDEQNPESNEADGGETVDEASAVNEAAQPSVSTDMPAGGAGESGQKEELSDSEGQPENQEENQEENQSGEQTDTKELPESREEDSAEDETVPDEPEAASENSVEEENVSDEPETGAEDLNENESTPDTLDADSEEQTEVGTASDEPEDGSDDTTEGDTASNDPEVGSEDQAEDEPTTDDPEEGSEDPGEGEVTTDDPEEGSEDPGEGEVTTDDPEEGSEDPSEGEAATDYPEAGSEDPAEGEPTTDDPEAGSEDPAEGEAATDDPETGSENPAEGEVITVDPEAGSEDPAEGEAATDDPEEGSEDPAEGEVTTDDPEAGSEDPAEGETVTDDPEGSEDLAEGAPATDDPEGSEDLAEGAPATDDPEAGSEDPAEGETATDDPEAGSEDPAEGETATDDPEAGSEDLAEGETTPDDPEAGSEDLAEGETTPDDPEAGSDEMAEDESALDDSETESEETADTEGGDAQNNETADTENESNEADGENLNGDAESEGGEEKESESKEQEAESVDETDASGEDTAESDEALSDNEAVVTVVQEVSESATPGIEMTEEEYEQLLTEYIAKVLQDSKGTVEIPRPIMLKAMKVNGNKLTGANLELYNQLKAKIKETAEGSNTSTSFSISFASLGIKTTYTADDFGLGSESTYEDGLAKLDELVGNTLDFEKVMAALMTDCPYELYWYDKTGSGGYNSGFRRGAKYDANGWEVSLSDDISIDMKVAKAYSQTDEQGTTAMNTAKGQAVQAAVATAKSIVDKYADATDYEKLQGYIKEICNLVDYNYPAAEDDTTPYGDPWQLVFVFDGDDDTKVVCEGYSKAFQYLCDLTEFDSEITCYTVSGVMAGGTGAGPHMWNIVTMDDGKNYLVDVTNSDEGSIGQDGSLVLKGAASGDADSQYTYKNGQNNQIVYKYDMDEMGIVYNLDELTLSGENYTPTAHTDVAGSDHRLEKVEAKAATCDAAGTEEYWVCSKCGKTFSDKAGRTEITPKETAALGHDYGPWTVVKEATEEEAGLRRRVCSRDASHVEEEVIPKLVHTHNLTKTEASAATCTAAGNTAYWTCSKCGKLFSDAEGTTEISQQSTVIAAKGHSMTRTAAAAATCEAAGHTEYWTCSVCKQMFSDEAGSTTISQADTVIPALGHKYGAWTVVKAATEEAEGTEQRVCEHDKSHVETRSIPKLNHVHDLKKTEAAGATCTAAGNIAYWTCSKCGKLFRDAEGTEEIAKEDTVVAAAGHRLEKVNAVEAKCEQDGSIEYWKCTVCGDLFADEAGNEKITLADTIAPATGHKLIKTDAVPATCTEQGHSAYWTCSTCGKLFSDETGKTETTLEKTVVPAAGHTLTKTEAVPATCTEQGHSEYWTCGTCGKLFSDETGKTETTLEKTVVPAAGHTLTKTEAVPATCTEQGHSEYWTCGTCGKLFSDEKGETETTLEKTVVPAAGHKLTKTEAVPATCTEKGNTAYWTCETCGKLFSDEQGKTETTLENTVVSALGHAYGEWTEVKPATEEEEGSEQRICSHDNTHVETRAIPKLNHVHVLNKTEASAATCTASGNIEYWTCSGCGRLFRDAEGTEEINKEDTVTAPVSHKLNKTEAAAATCTDAGHIEYWTCSECSKMFSDAEGTKEITADAAVIAALGHNLQKTEAAAATCTEPGHTAYWTCTVCKKLFSDEAGTKEINQADTVVAASGHNLTKVAAADPSCEKAGSIEYWECETCKKLFGDAEGSKEIAEKDTVAAALGHKLQKVSAVPADCEHAGIVEHWKCTVCGDLFADEAGTKKITQADTVVEALGHKLQKTEADAATCTEPGNTAYWTCTVCKKLFSDEAGTKEINQADTVVAAAGHNLTKVAAADPSCEKTGNIEYWKCETCKKLYGDAEGSKEITEESTVVAALGHKLQKVSAVPADCEHAGIVEHWKCTVCGDLFADEAGTKKITQADTVVAALGHKLQKTEAVAATCTEPGNTAYWTCTVCKKLFSDEAGTKEITQADTVVAAAGHTLTKVAAADPSCEKAGNIEYWKCETCKKLFGDAEGSKEITEESTVVAALGHKLQKVNAVPADCELAGVVEHWKCTVCGDLFADEAGTTKITQADTVAAALGHKLQKTEAVAATCTEPGNTAYWICTVCKKLFSDEAGTKEITLADTVVAAVGHNLTKVAAADPSCEKTGNIEYWKCETCKKLYGDAEGSKEITEESTVVAALGHKLQKVNAVPADCEHAGNIEHWKCTVCGDLFTDEAGTTKITQADTVVTALGHKLQKTEAAAATCEQDGNIEYWTCGDCKKLFADEAGTQEITRNDTVIGAFGHEYGPWKATEAATKDKEGVEQRVCSHDSSHVEIRAIPKLDHDHVMEKTEAAEATCTDDGNIEYWTCSVCGKIYTDEIGLQEVTAEETTVKARGHAYGEWKVTRAAACEEAGEETRTCANDEAHTETREIAALGHLLEKVEAKDATEEAEGNTAYWKCSRCGKLYADEAGSKEISLEDTVIQKLEPKAEDEPAGEENKPADTEPSGTPAADDEPSPKPSEGEPPATKPDVRPVNPPAIEIIPDEAGDSSQAPTDNEKPVVTQVKPVVTQVKEPAVITLLDVVNRVSDELAAKTDIRVWVDGIEAALTPEEYASVSKMPVREQLLIWLAVLGFEADLQKELAGISSEAREMLSAILERLATIPAEEKMAWLIPGRTEANQASVRICIQEADKTRYEDYLFTYTDGKWVIE